MHTKSNNIRTARRDRKCEYCNKGGDTCPLVYCFRLLSSTVSGYQRSLRRLTSLVRGLLHVFVRVGPWWDLRGLTIRPGGHCRRRGERCLLLGVLGLPRLGRRCIDLDKLVLLLFLLLHSEEGLRSVDSRQFRNVLTSAMYPRAIHRRCRFSWVMLGSESTLSAVSRMTLSTSSLAPFQRVRIPCSAACSSSFLRASGARPAFSAACSLSKTALRSIAARSVDTLRMSGGIT